MKVAWFYANISRGLSQFTRANKFSAEVEYLNTMFSSTMSKALKINKNIRVNPRTTQTQTPSPIILTLKICTLARSPVSLLELISSVLK